MAPRKKGSREPVVLPPLLGWRRVAAGTALVLAVLLGLTALAWQRTRQAEEQERRDDFEDRLRDAQARIGARMEAYEQVLRGTAAALGAGPLMGRAAFHDYVATLHLEDHYPGIQGLGFSLLVPARDLPAHTAAVRAEGFPGYQMRPPGAREAYSSIVYLEPFSDRNLRAFGYDMFAEPVRRAAMEKARDEGQAALSGPVVLVQETGRDVQPGVLMYHPVYTPGPAPRGVAERRARLVGWAYMPFRMGDLVAGTLGAHPQDLATRIDDASPGEAGGLLFDSEAGAPAAPAGRFAGRRIQQVVDRPWAIRLASRPAFDARRAGRRAGLVAAGGLATSLLLPLLVWTLASGRDRAVRLATATNQRLLASNAELVESEGRLAAMIQGADDGYVDLDVGTGAVVRSPRCWEVIGWRPGTLAPTLAASLALVHPEDAERLGAAVGRLRTGEAERMDEEYRLRGGDGAYRWVRSRLGAVGRDPAGRPLRITGAISDAERPRRLREQAIEEARLRSLSGRMNEAELVIDAEGRLVEANDRACELYGRTRAELVGRHVETLRAEEDRPAAAAQFREALAGGVRFRARHLRSDGAAFPVEVSSRAFEVGGARYVHSLVRDLTEQGRQEARLIEAHEALRASEARLQHVLDGANDGFWDWEIATGRVVFSARWAEMIGHDLAELEPSVATWERLVHPDDLPAVMAQVQAMLSGASPRYQTEHRLRHKDGRWIWVLDRGKVVERDGAGAAVRAAGTHTDITARVTLAARAAQAERVAATATLARGMAHEINNPLASVTTNLHFTREQLEGAAGAAARGEPVDPGALLEEVSQAIADAADGAARIRGIVADLRTFALGDLPAGAASTSLAGAVEAARRVAGKALARCAAVEVAVPEVEGLGLALPDLIQLLAHLLINAGQATGEVPNVVRVEASAGPGRLELRVSDTGVGMTAAVRARAFEPFFTTRDVGQGRGLGLSVCLGIVRAAGGEIDLASAPGQGTTVTVTLPLRHGPAEAAPSQAGA